MQAPRRDVGPTAELAARVQLGEDHLDPGQPGLGLDVDGDAAPVVVDLDRPVTAQRDLDQPAYPSQRLVDAELIELVRPEVYAKGGDYTPEMLPETPIVERLGGEVRVLDYLSDHSTTAIVTRIRATPAAR